MPKQFMSSYLNGLSSLSETIDLDAHDVFISLPNDAYQRGTIFLFLGTVAAALLHPIFPAI